MKAIFAVFVFALAVASAYPDPEGPAGKCPEVDGEYPVYLLDIKNRFVYYECSNGEPKLEKCSANLVFNPYKNICDYPSKTISAFGPVGECPAEDTPLPTLLRDGANIAVFYFCRDGQPVPMMCDEGLVFDPYRNSCYAEE